jgi:hypothetical protein
MSERGQERRIRIFRNSSVLPPTTDMEADIALCSNVPLTKLKCTRCLGSIKADRLDRLA